MARKATADSESPHGFNDIIGAVLMCFAALLLVALLSYQSAGRLRQRGAHQPVRAQLDRPFGAGMAYYCFFCLGAAAYFLPVLLFFLGLGYFLEGFAYLRRRWLWLVVFMVCCMGLLDLYRKAVPGRSRKISASPRRHLGRQPEPVFLRLFRHGRGDHPIFLTLYFISLLFLTNFQLGQWIRNSLGRANRPSRAADAPDEQALERRARELHQQAKKLQDEVARSGLGADMKPVPEPTVRDLSVPQARPARPKKPQPEPAKEPAPADEGEVIPAREVAAATTAEVLGKPADASVEEKKPETPLPEPVVSHRRRLRGRPPRPSRSPRPGSPRKSPSPPPRSSAITSCRRSIFCGSPIPRSSPRNRKRN